MTVNLGRVIDQLQEVVDELRRLQESEVGVSPYPPELFITEVPSCCDQIAHRIADLINFPIVSRIFTRNGVIGEPGRSYLWADNYDAEKQADLEKIFRSLSGYAKEVADDRS